MIMLRASIWSGSQKVGQAPKETLIYCLRGRNPALRGARKLAYLHDMSPILCSVRLVFRSALIINQRLLK